MKRCLAATFVALVVMLAPGAQAQDKSSDVTDLRALRTAVQSDKRGYVAALLKLTDAESKRFWPLYDGYQRALDNATRRRSRAVEDLVAIDRPVSDAYARNLVGEWIASDEEEIKARRVLQNRLLRALPPKKAARYLQLESKTRAVDAYDIAAGIPLIK